MKPEVLMWFEVENKGVRPHFHCFLLGHRVVLPKLTWNIHSVSLIHLCLYSLSRFSDASNSGVCTQTIYASLPVFFINIAFWNTATVTH